MKPTIFLTTVALATLAGCSSHKGDDEGASLLSGKLPAVAQQPKPTASVANSQAPSKDAAGEQPTPVQWTRSIKSTSRQVAISELAKGNFYESVVSEVEGFRPSLYNDNTGYAIGNGWNVSLQSQHTNQRISQGIGMAPTEAMAVTNLSGQLNPTRLPQVSITPEQAITAAQLMRPQYEEPMKGLIGSDYDKLKPNEKAVLAYHAYKVGPAGAAKYKNLIGNLKQYLKSPSPELSRKVAEGFTYSYMLNGERRYDTRSQVYMTALWLDPQAYGFLLGNNPAPADFKQTAHVFAQKVDPSKPVDSQVKDELEDAKAKLYEKGIVPKIVLEGPAPAKPSGPSKGVPAAWY